MAKLLDLTRELQTRSGLLASRPHLVAPGIIAVTLITEGHPSWPDTEYFTLDGTPVDRDYKILSLTENFFGKLENVPLATETEPAFSICDVVSWGANPIVYGKICEINRIGERFVYHVSHETNIPNLAFYRDDLTRIVCETVEI